MLPPEIQESRIIKKARRIAFLSLVFFMAFPFFPVNPHEIQNPLSQYLSQKALCDYAGAMEILEDWTCREKDTVIFEINVFRIYELVKYPELMEKAIGAYKNISANAVVRGNPALKARIEIFLNILYLRKGYLREAAAIRSGLGFIGKYRMIGPFEYAAGLNESFMAAKDIDEKYPEGRGYAAKWFDASADLTGKVDAADLFGSAPGSIFYLKSIVTVPDDGSYILWLGKIGHTDIWMDGNKFFSNRKRHDFGFDQYALGLFLSKGRHVLLIKSGESDSSAAVALRLTDDKGNAVTANADSGSCIGQGSGSYCSRGKISLFNAMESTLNKKPVNGELSFNAGYLYYISGLNSLEDRESAAYFSEAGDAELSSASCYYLGLMERETERKNFYFNESLGSFKGNAESLREIIDIKLRNDLLYEVYPLIHRIAEISPRTALIDKIKAEALIRRGWFNEALKQASILKDSDVKSAGYEIESRVYLKSKKYSKALNACKRLYESDRYSMGSLDDLLECYLKTGRYDDADKLLDKCAVLYPNSVILRLKHAWLIENTKGPGEALPYILCCRRISPCNKTVLLNTGLLFHKLDADEIALRYLNAAFQYDQKDAWTAGYIGLIKNRIKAGDSKYPRDNRAGSLEQSYRNSPNPKKNDIRTGSSTLENSVKKEPESFESLEREIFKSIFAGSGMLLFNNIERLLKAYPAEPESVLYYREIAKLAHIAGYERALKTLQGLIGSVNGLESFEKKNLCVMLLKLELEKLLYRCNKKEAERLTEEFSPVRRWSLLGPYSRYGVKDMDYSFLPELAIDFENPDIKKKGINIQDATGEINFGKYLYPENGIAYAVTTIGCDKPVKIRIYSSCPYKLFINGKETIENLKTGIFRTCRIVRVWDAPKITLMIKLLINGKGDALRVLVTDQDDGILNIKADPSEIVFSDFNFLEETDYPFGRFSDAGPGKAPGALGSADLRLALYFRGVGSPEALKFYRKTLAGENAHDPVISFFFAECLLGESKGYNDSRYMEAMDIIAGAAKRYPDFIPAQQIRLKDLTRSGKVHEALSEYNKLMDKGAEYLPLRLDYAGLLLRLGYDREFEQEIDSLESKFPYSIHPLLLLASYYRDRNVLKSVDIHKKITAMEKSGESLEELISIYNEQARYRDIDALTGSFDEDPCFKKDLIESLIDSGNYAGAKKLLFRETVIKEDPYYYKKLGEIGYLEGSDPEMYWQKALSINPSDFSLRDFLCYLETGRIENPFNSYTDQSIDMVMPDDNIQNGYSHVLKRSMIFLLNKDGGSRVFCGDTVFLADPKDAGKWSGYRTPFPGQVHPVYKSIRSLKQGSILQIGYFIDDPLKPGGGSAFFTTPYIKIRDVNEAVSLFSLKVIAPADMKVAFSFNRDVEIRTGNSNDKTIYTAELGNLTIRAGESAEDKTIPVFAFSTMSDIKDFVLWYRGRIEGAFNIEADGIMPRFSGKISGGVLKAVYDYAARDIELRGNDLFSPHEPLDTLFKKTGSAENKTILAASILSGLGIRSYIAFTGRNDYLKDASFVSPAIFTNILLYVPLDIKNGLWMDFSNARNDYGYVDAALNGRDAVVIVKDGYEIKKIRVN